MSDPRLEPVPPFGGGDLITEADIYLFNEGTHRKLADKLGAHLAPEGGAHFAVWAPNVSAVSVIGDFNYWDHNADPLAPRDVSGIWLGHVATAKKGDVYEFRGDHGRRGAPREGRPLRMLHRSPAADGVCRLGPRLRVARRRVDGD